MEPGSYGEWWAAVERGIARFEQDNLEVIRQARAPKPGHWQAAAWLLERRLPDRWSLKMEHKVQQEQAVYVEIALSPEAMAVLAPYLAQALPAFVEGEVTSSEPIDSE